MRVPCIYLLHTVGILNQTKDSTQIEHRPSITACSMKNHTMATKKVEIDKAWVSMCVLHALFINGKPTAVLQGDIAISSYLCLHLFIYMFIYNDLLNLYTYGLIY